GEHMYLIGEGASLEGDRPFLDRFNLKTKRKKRLFRSKKPYFETPITLMDTEFEEILVVRESKTTPPNYYLWNDKEKFHSQITHVENPVPELANIQRRLLRYKRSDRLNLTANLYLPEGYNAKRDGPLPTLVWAYPRAYQTAENASQLKKSPYQFIKGRWNRPIIWVLRGYAVLDDPAMPIIAEGRNNPNDSFIPQLVDSARAAVRELVRQGVSEKGKIALGGHSYGAFMTANLLAHSDLFCAGIARSGSYNRTLTPFGFQSEERDLWRAPKVYLEMSPFLNAPLINEPLLLFHGMEDRNPGTYPMQSERLFHALNGIGGQARYIQFPNEGHSFRGYDSIMHMLWEIERWLEVHVKGETYPPVNPIAPQPGHGNTVSAAAEISEETADLE
ncbi:MAG: prolyl oligopeptidase family serine peptidase, partial [Verrucomicrobia bacterium]|nr:prolyl oligopeptidase family serine peptidase [Verrucomicrobiota bacterium]